MGKIYTNLQSYLKQVVNVKKSLVADSILSMLQQNTCILFFFILSENEEKVMEREMI